MFEDDRFLRRSDELKDLVADEVAYVFGLDDYFWRRLARIIGLHEDDSFGFRDDVLHTLCTNAAYLHDDAFRILEQLPMSLTQGNIAQKLDDLNWTDS